MLSTNKFNQYILDVNTHRIEPWTTKSGLQQAYAQVLEEYQMVMHLFGAASSPASSNFACAQDGRATLTISREVVSSVNKSFYDWMNLIITF